MFCKIFVYQIFSTNQVNRFWNCVHLVHLYNPASRSCKDTAYLQLYVRKTFEISCRCEELLGKTITGKVFSILTFDHNNTVQKSVAYFCPVNNSDREISQHMRSMWCQLSVFSYIKFYDVFILQLYPDKMGQEWNKIFGGETLSRQ